MSGLDEKQWGQVEARLTKIDGIEDELKDITKAIAKLHTGMVILGNEIGVTVFGDNMGKKTGNGLTNQVKANATEINTIKHKPVGNALKTWIQIVASALVIATTIYVAASFSIKKDIQIQQLQQSQQSQPGPTP